MDITKTRDKISFSNLFNAQTVNYSVVYALGLLIFIVLKQLLKHLVGLSGDISLPVAACHGAAGKYYLLQCFPVGTNWNMPV